MAQLSDLFQMLGPQGDPDSLFGNPDIQQFIKNLADSHTIAGTPGFVVTDPTAPQPVPDQTNLSTPSGVPGISIDSGNNAAVPPLPAQRDLTGYAGQGQPYEAPKPQPEQPQVTTASVNPNAPQRSGSIVPDLTFGQRLRNAAMALQGQAPPDTDAQKLQANATYDALIKKGVDPAAAKAVVLNPALAQQVLPTLFGPKSTTFARIGSDKFGNPTFGFIDPGTKQVTPVNPGANAAPSGNPDLTGEAFLDSLKDKGTSDQVRAIVQGRLSPPGGMALKTPYWQRMLEYAAQYEPGFDLTKWTGRNAARKEFEAGGPNSPAGNITAGNTAIQHLGQLSDAASKLDNFGSAGPLTHTFNKVRNAYNEQSGTATDLTNFNTIRDRYIEEITKFYRGTGGNQADIERATHNLDAAKSPRELQQAIKAEADLMQSKVNALQDRWRTAMGPNAGDFPIIQDKTKEALATIDKNFGAVNGHKPLAPNATPAAPGQWTTLAPNVRIREKS